MENKMLHHQHILFCSLTEPIITNEYDFIPKGTIVQVIGWDEKDSNKLLVRVSAYVHAGPLEKNQHGYIPNVNEGLIITADPGMLKFKSKESFLVS